MFERYAFGKVCLTAAAFALVGSVAFAKAGLAAAEDASPVVVAAVSPVNSTVEAQPAYAEMKSLIPQQDAAAAAASPTVKKSGIAAVPSLPIPGALVLFGSGLVALAVVGHRHTLRNTRRAAQGTSHDHDRGVAS